MRHGSIRAGPERTPCDLRISLLMVPSPDLGGNVNTT